MLVIFNVIYPAADTTYHHRLVIQYQYATDGRRNVTADTDAVSGICSRRTTTAQEEVEDEEAFSTVCNISMLMM